MTIHTYKFPAGPAVGTSEGKWCQKMVPENGASHQIWAICEITQIWWLAPFLAAAAEGVGRGGDADAGQGDRARLGHDHARFGGWHRF
jgi:hypothetical protein